MSQETLDKLVADKANDKDGLTAKDRTAIDAAAKKCKDCNTNLSYARLAMQAVLSVVKDHVANWDMNIPGTRDYIAEHQYGPAVDRLNEIMARGRAAQAKGDKQAFEAAAKEYQLAEMEVLKFKAAAEKAPVTDADRCVFEKMRPAEMDAGIGDLKSLKNILAVSALVDKFQCGNCSELTAKAFTVLHNMSVSPLNVVALKNPADHVFVVIGRTVQSDKPADWNAEAVVCDPWAVGLIKPTKKTIADLPSLPMFGRAFGAYPVKLLDQNMKSMHSQFSGVTIEF